MTQKPGTNVPALPASGSARKPYRTPQLHTYGDLTEVTRLTGAMGGIDNPSGKKVKTSP
jgi:hypothetical protein